MLAIDEADVILFLVEVSTGITDLTRSGRHPARTRRKVHSGAATKVYNCDQLYSSHEFYTVGLADPTASLDVGKRHGDLMDAI